MGILNFAVQAVRLGIFMLFLIMAAWQDFKTKEINVRLFWIFGVAGLGLCCLSGVETAADVLASAQSQRLLPELWGNVFQSFLLGQLPGLALFLFFKYGEGIGKGDCWFFLICGWYLGLWDTIFVLGGAVLICGLAGLGYYVSGCIQGSQTGRMRRKMQWPFLPFAAVPGIWIAAVRLRDTIRMIAMLRRFCL